MFKVGEIVTHTNLVFYDGIPDIKPNRPCIVLFSKRINGFDYVCTCPLAANLRHGDKWRENYMLIPHYIFDYKKLSFACFENIDYRLESETISTGMMVDQNIVKMIIEKYKAYNPTIEQVIEKHNIVVEDINEIETFDYNEVIMPVRKIIEPDVVVRRRNKKGWKYNK
ncbi:MAG: hypothetical protein IJ574_03955 [Bacilli bacterium]|nr:hypothetical protein [Bacilli bacterium]